MNSTQNKEITKVRMLNAAYLQLVMHLGENSHFSDLLGSLGVSQEMYQTLKEFKADQVADLLACQSTLMFKLEVDESLVDDLLVEQATTQTNPYLPSILSKTSSVMELATNPSKAFIHVVIKEVNSMGALSTKVGYRFNLEQQTVDRIHLLTLDNLYKLAASSDTWITPKFSMTHLLAAGKTGCVPVSLLMSV